MAESKFLPFLRRWLGALGRTPPGAAADDPTDRPPTTPPFPLDRDDALSAASLQKVRQRLEARRGNRAFLTRADIDPGELVFALPLTALVEVHHEPDRFRHRLVGTGFREALGFEATGIWVDEWPQPEHRALIAAAYQAVVDARAPMGLRHDLTIEGQPVRYEALIMPLAADGTTIDMLLVVASAGTPHVDPT